MFCFLKGLGLTPKHLPVMAQADAGVFVTCANSVFSVYVYMPDGLNGPTVNKLESTTPIPSGATPVTKTATLVGRDAMI